MEFRWRGGRNQIVVQNSSYIVFYAFLKYLYTGKILFLFCYIDTVY